MKQLVIDLTASDNSGFIILGILVLVMGVFAAFAVFAENRERIFPVWASVAMLLFGLFLSVGMGYVAPKLDGESAYQTVAQGTYQEATYSASGGLFSQPFTVIHFTDGRTFTLPGQQDIPFSKGTPIVIEKNKRYLKVKVLGRKR